jgi:hypothetical protein
LRRDAEVRTFRPVVAQRKPNRKERRKAKAFGDPNAPPDFIVDTNVWLDIHSCHDVSENFDALHAQIGDAAIDDPAITYRLARARDAALLAMYFHKIKATTMALTHEAIELLRRRSPPAPGGSDLRADFTRAFAHFVHPFCLRRWTSVITTEHGMVNANAADRAHVALARARSIPLISNEGLRRDGTIDHSKLIRVEAAAAGVTVLTPRQVFENQINEEEEIEAFLTRFRERVPVYLERRGIRDRMGELLGIIIGMYRMTLRGEVEGRDTPVRVRI